jgi:hypothetical protein
MGDRLFLDDVCAKTDALIANVGRGARDEFFN